jgi:hypothetical protein
LKVYLFFRKAIEKRLVSGNDALDPTRNHGPKTVNREAKGASQKPTQYAKLRHQSDSKNSEDTLNTPPEGYLRPKALMAKGSDYTNAVML